MKEISEQIYHNVFEPIYDWFRINVHSDPDSYWYEILDLERTDIKMIELINKTSGNPHFRVLLKATQDPIDETFLPAENLREVGYLQNTKTNNSVISGTAYQICYIHQIS